MEEAEGVQPCDTFPCPHYNIQTLMTTLTNLK